MPKILHVGAMYSADHRYRPTTVTCWDNAPMERFFRSLKAEWGPETGYRSFAEAKQSITDYLVGYYSQIRPHRHNDEVPPNAAEKLYWKAYKPVASFT